jgi:hypothetical protein
MDSKKSGMELLEILLIVFVILKLVGTIDWSWWWVLSPLLIPIGLLIVVLIVFGIISVIIK